jgi:hypothetical protein
MFENLCYYLCLPPPPPSLKLGHQGTWGTILSSVSYYLPSIGVGSCSAARNLMHTLLSMYSIVHANCCNAMFSHIGHNPHSIVGYLYHTWSVSCGLCSCIYSVSPASWMYLSLSCSQKTICLLLSQTFTTHCTWLISLHSHALHLNYLVSTYSSHSSVSVFFLGWHLHNLHLSFNSKNSLYFINRMVLMPPTSDVMAQLSLLAVA